VTGSDVLLRRRRVHLGGAGLSLCQTTASSCLVSVMGNCFRVSRAYASFADKTSSSQLSGNHQRCLSVSQIATLDLFNIWQQ